MRQRYWTLIVKASNAMDLAQKDSPLAKECCNPILSAALAVTAVVDLALDYDLNVSTHNKRLGLADTRQDCEAMTLPTTLPLRGSGLSPSS